MCIIWIWQDFTIGLKYKYKFISTSILFLLFTCCDLQNIETSKQRINVESITKSLAGSL
jgi:hypothetical protein